MIDFLPGRVDIWFKEQQILLDQSFALVGDASSRKYARIISRNKSYILVEYEQTETAKLSFERFLFWQKKYKSHQLSVPEVLHVNNDHKYMVISDFGDTSLLAYLVGDGLLNQNTYLLKSIDLIASIQKLHASETSHATNLIFNQEKLLFELNTTLNYFTKTFSLSSLVANHDEIVTLWKKLWTESFNPQEYVWCHRDFHAKNLMIFENELKIIDFQDTMKGPITYDLCSLIHDCYFNYTLEQKEKFLLYAYEILASKDHVSKEAFLKSYYAVCAQRTFKAIGSFCYIFQERKNYSYLRHVGLAMDHFGKSLKKLDTNESMMLFNLIVRPYYEI